MGSAKSQRQSKRIVSGQAADYLIDATARAAGTNINLQFLKDEWRLIVDAGNMRVADHYREIPRLGRNVRMAASRPDEVWQIFQAAWDKLR